MSKRTHAYVELDMLCTAANAALSAAANAVAPLSEGQVLPPPPAPTAKRRRPSSAPQVATFMDLTSSTDVKAESASTAPTVATPVSVISPPSPSPSPPLAKKRPPAKRVRVATLAEPNINKFPDLIKSDPVPKTTRVVAIGFLNPSTLQLMFDNGSIVLKVEGSPLFHISAVTKAKPPTSSMTPLESVGSAAVVASSGEEKEAAYPNYIPAFHSTDNGLFRLTDQGKLVVTRFNETISKIICSSTEHLKAVVNAGGKIFITSDQRTAVLSQEIPYNCEFHGPPAIGLAACGDEVFVLERVKVYGIDTVTQLESISFQLGFLYDWNPISITANDTTIFVAAQSPHHEFDLQDSIVFLSKKTKRCVRIMAEPGVRAIAATNSKLAVLTPGGVVFYTL